MDLSKTQDIIAVVASDGSFYFHGDALMAFSGSEIGSEDYNTLKNVLKKFAEGKDDRPAFVRFKPIEFIEVI